MGSDEESLAQMLRARETLRQDRSLLVALSGIDGSGKGYVAAHLTAALADHGLRVAIINVDAWLNLPHVRFNPSNPAPHFYHHAIRFDALFEQLLLPLREHRRVSVVADLAGETATSYRPHHYEYAGVDLVLVEGIFLLRRDLRPHYDLSFWIDCTFETALERALARAQEGLPPVEAEAAYRTIYFPAQRLHLALDAPRDAASGIIRNDSRLDGPAPLPRHVERDGLTLDRER